MENGRVCSVSESKNLVLVRKDGKQQIKWYGNVDSFKLFVREVLVIDGSWKYIENSGGFHCLKSKIATLSFYPSTKTIQFQGSEARLVKRKIEDIIASKSTIELEFSDDVTSQEIDGTSTLIEESEDDEDYNVDEDDAVITDEISEITSIDKINSSTTTEDDRFNELNTRFNMLLTEVQDIKKTLAGQENQAKNQFEFNKMRDLINMQNLEIRNLKEENKSLLTVIRILSSDSNNSNPMSYNPPIVPDQVMGDDPPIVPDQVIPESKTNNQPQQAPRNNPESRNINIDPIPNKRALTTNRSTTTNADVIIIGDSMIKHID